MPCECTANSGSSFDSMAGMAVLSVRMHRRRQGVLELAQLKRKNEIARMIFTVKERHDSLEPSPAVFVRRLCRQSAGLDSTSHVGVPRSPLRTFESARALMIVPFGAIVSHRLEEKKRQLFDHLGSTDSLVSSSTCTSARTAAGLQRRFRSSPTACAISLECSRSHCAR